MQTRMRCVWTQMVVSKDGGKQIRKKKLTAFISGHRCGVDQQTDVISNAMWLPKHTQNFSSQVVTLPLIRISRPHRPSIPSVNGQGKFCIARYKSSLILFSLFLSIRITLNASAVRSGPSEGRGQRQPNNQHPSDCDNARRGPPKLR